MRVERVNVSLCSSAYIYRAAKSVCTSSAGYIFAGMSLLLGITSSLRQMRPNVYLATPNPACVPQHTEQATSYECRISSVYECSRSWARDFLH